MRSKQQKMLAEAILTPISYIYKCVIGVRNFLFNVGFIKQTKFKVPIVVVGNLSVGGTGKTPLTEFIINALSTQWHIGVLSRGYKRRTKGFILATRRLSPHDIGDEPFQMYAKFGDRITLAVCEDRRKGIREMMKIDPSINLFVLDDAFQHRYVKPKVAIVLMDYNHPCYQDKMLPLGRLREPMDSIYRADMVVVTKCPEDLKPFDLRTVKNNLDLIAAQKLFFSSVKYAAPSALFPDENNLHPYLEYLTDDDGILIVTGIANPKPFVKYLRNFKSNMKILHFGDHHDFTRNDFDLICERFDELKGNRKMIFTTEKDAVRLISNPYFPHQLKAFSFFIPITVDFSQYNEGNNFVESLKEEINRK
jgi:tetraacyldisaccharide 4'-kinase